MAPSAYDKNRVVPADDVGPGWTRLDVPRQKGNHIDKYWFSPVKHHRFRSKAEIKRYKIALEAAPRHDEDAAWHIFKNVGKADFGKRKHAEPVAPAASSSSSSSPAASSSAAAAKKLKKSSSPPPKKSSQSSKSAPGADAGAGHTKKQPSQKTVKVSRKPHRSGIASVEGFVPAADPKGKGRDGPYIPEDEIPRAYNFPKTDEKDDDEDDIPEIEGVGGDKPLPYRHINNWFLAMPGGRSRVPLPENCRDIGNAVIYGDLLPSPRRVRKALAKGKEPPQNLPVVIRRATLWSIDRDPDDRGIWIGTDDGWYKLEKPCSAKVYRDPSTNAQVSQEDLHQPLRAKFALLSNLLDMFTESSASLDLSHFFGLHSCRLPTESHALLQPTEEDRKKYPELLSEPFDLELLKREAKFILTHLRGVSTDLGLNTSFMKGLAQLGRDSGKLKKADAASGFTFDYEASAKATEKRTRRLPWGCPSFDSRNVTSPIINRLIEIKVERNKKGEKNGGKTGPTPSTSRPAQAKPVKTATATSAKKAKESAERNGSGSKDVVSKPRASPDDKKMSTEKPVRKLSSSEGSLFDSDPDDEEYEPQGAVAKKSSNVSDGTADSGMQFKVEYAHPYPILIECVKRKCSQKLRPFLDNAAAVLENRAEPFISSCVTLDSVSSYEYMLVVAESLSVSKPSVLRRLFDEKRTVSAGCRSVFVFWLGAAKGRMEARRSKEEEREILKAVGESHKTEEELAMRIVRLARKCFSSETGITPDHVLDNFHFDIIKIVKELKAFAQHHKINNVLRVCESTLGNLRSLRKKSNAGTPSPVSRSASRSAADAFGMALEEPNQSAKKARKSPKANVIPVAHSSDALSYKAKGKAASAMETANGSGARSIGSGKALLPGAVFASELGLPLPGSKMKKSKGHARSTPIPEK